MTAAALAALAPSACGTAAPRASATIGVPDRGIAVSPAIGITTGTTSIVYRP